MSEKHEGPSFFESNRQVLENRYPEIWATCDAVDAESVSLVYDGNDVVNLKVGGVDLYQDRAANWTQAHLDEYFKDPDRIGFDDPKYCNLSPISSELLAEIRNYIQSEDVGEIANYPVVDSGFCFVFGVSLGLHIKPLIERTKAKVMVLIEPQPALLRASFEAIDWAEIVELADNLSIEIRFLVGKRPQENVRNIERYIWQDGQTFLEGSYAYIHYPSWELIETRKILNEKIPVTFLSAGFYEDEMLMMANSYGNMHRFPLSFLDRKPAVARKFPVFIVGSGPSLDKSLDVIKKYRKKAIVFSCGSSSLGILLANGIVPDFHGENENSWPLVENLRGYAKKYDLSPITLIASTSVNPEASKLFSRRWFYYRAGLSCTFTLNQGVLPLMGADPMVANSAFASMISVGFREFYLFGVDCGRRVDSGHHASEAIYYDEDYDNYLEGESFEMLENEFNRSVPANFGGEALTTWYLDMSRASFAMLQQQVGTRLFNCSDGAKIDGAMPKAAAALKLDGPEGFQKQLIENIDNAMHTYQAGEYLSGLDLKDQLEKCDVFEEEFLTAIDEALSEDQSFWVFHERMIKLRVRLGPSCMGVLSIIRSSYLSMIRVGAFGGTRIEDEEKRMAFLRFFIGAYKNKVQMMIDASRNLLRQMVDEKDVIEGVPGVGPG